MRTRLKVEGFRELRAALENIDKGLVKELRKEINKVSDLIVDEAAGRVPVDSGALRDSIRARSTAKEGRVIMGRSRVPYAGWIDFGGTISPRGSPITRQFVRSGRYLFPSADELAPRIRKETFDMIERAAKKAGLG